MYNLLTISEAAELLGVSTKTIRRWVCLIHGVGLANSGVLIKEMGLTTEAK